MKIETKGWLNEQEVNGRGGYNAFDGKKLDKFEIKLTFDSFEDFETERSFIHLKEYMLVHRWCFPKTGQEKHNQK